MPIRPLILTYAHRWLPNDTSFCIPAHLDKNRFQPLVALSREGSLAERLREHDVPVQVVPGLERWTGGWQRLRAGGVVRRLVEVARGHQATFVQADRGPVVPWGVRVARRTGLPIIGCIRNRYSRNRTRRYLLPQVDRVIANNRAALESKRDLLPMEGSRVIPNGMDLRAFDAREPRRDVRKELGIPPDALVAGAVVLRRIKRPDWVVRAAAELAETLPSVHWLLVGGFSDPDWEREILGSVSQHGLAGRFHFPGFQDSMPPFFRAMDLLCHPSRREGAPRAVLEAMAAGCPVVAAEVDGVPDLVEHGGTGFLFPVDDFEAFRDSVRRVLHEEGVRRRMGAAARARIEERFTMRSAVAAYEDFYEGLIA
jgi:glycosyltransferase involved in cell wall biosynthesis